MPWPTEADIERNRIRREEREADQAASVGRIVIEITCADYGDVAPEIMLDDFRNTATHEGWHVRIVNE